MCIAASRVSRAAESRVGLFAQARRGKEVQTLRCPRNCDRGAIPLHATGPCVREGGGKALIREPGDLPMTVVRPRAGCIVGKRGRSNSAPSRHGRRFVYDRRLRVQISVFPDGFGHSRYCIGAEPERTGAGRDRRPAGCRRGRDGRSLCFGGSAARRRRDHGYRQWPRHRSAQYRPVGHRHRPHRNRDHPGRRSGACAEPRSRPVAVAQRRDRHGDQRQCTRG